MLWLPENIGNTFLNTFTLNLALFFSAISNTSMRDKLKQLPILPRPQLSAEIMSDSECAKSRGEYKQGYRKPMVV